MGDSSSKNRHRNTLNSSRDGESDRTGTATRRSASSTSLRQQSQPIVPQRLQPRRSHSSMATVRGYPPTIAGFPTFANHLNSNTITSYAPPPSYYNASYASSGSAAAAASAASVNTGGPAPISGPATSSSRTSGNNAAVDMESTDITYLQNLTPQALALSLAPPVDTPDIATGHTSSASISDNSQLYVSPKVIMHTSGTPHPQSARSSRRPSASPPLTSGIGKSQSNTLLQQQQPAHFSSYGNSQNIASMSFNTRSSHASPLIGSRNPNATLSPGFIFDPSWELPSPVTQMPGDGPSGAPSMTTRRNYTGHASHVPNSLAPSDVSMTPLPSGTHPPYTASAFDGNTAFLPNVQDQQYNNDFSIPQGQISPSISLYQAPLPSVSTAGSTNFRYGGYVDPGFISQQPYPAAPVGMTTSGSSAIQRSSSTVSVPRSLAGTPRPVSEPISGLNTDISGHSAMRFRSNTGIASAPAEQAVFPYSGPISMEPDSSSGWQASDLIPGHQPSPHNISTFHTSAVTPVRSLSHQGQSTLRFPIMSSANNQELGFDIDMHSQNPTVMHNRNATFPPRRISSRHHLDGSTTPLHYPSTPGAPSELGADNDQHPPTYITRTRMNMQGLMHSDHVEQGYPGEWGGAFR